MEVLRMLVHSAFHYFEDHLTRKELMYRHWFFPDVKPAVVRIAYLVFFHNLSWFTPSHVSSPSS